ncbi:MULTISPECIES: RNA polymerase factor sigma-54 [Agarivorans]|uniref:RNA polymerase sigma-54 factor n=1 Tax=Agarivorans albus MKT 106 TaxID=1331007 RepID=R9PHY6_AGAAL|nr:RNA polymerase factor sigma-54 [Agarivorans albus]GAD00975.1 RNA polymerase sigma-54 factor RpoN [Agarivorans albus MKT 106]
MKASLQLRLGQQLTMTPQLQQAIRLLQLSTLDLQQEIQEALESNPLLEADESHASDSDATDAKSANEKSTEAESTADIDNSQIEAGDAINQETVSDDLPVDSTWDDIYSASSAPASSSGSAVSDDNDMLFQGETVDSLQDHLLWQMQLTPFSEVDQAIALAIIDAVDESGYLTQDCEQLLEGLRSSDNNDLDVELDEVEAVLKRIQHFDPVGIAARSLQECLLIQLSRFAEDTPWLNEAKDVVSNHIDVLANRDFRLLARKTKLKEDQLREVMRLIHTLEPRPGNAVEPNQAQYVIPDVSVVKRQGRWVVELNPDAMPKLRVNSHYASLSKTSTNANDTQFIRSHLQEAKWFIKSIESRNETLLKVSNCIVHHQQAFFEYGEEAMKPMVLNDVAEAVEMHESTISRVTTQKFMHTPRGIFELKYFFSSHVATDGGGECSSTAIRALIKKLVAAENTSKPLSDSKIADILADQGIKVARRTIAKYRESLAIPPSNQRKSLI